MSLVREAVERAMRKDRKRLIRKGAYFDGKHVDSLTEDEAKQLLSEFIWATCLYRRNQPATLSARADLCVHDSVL